MKPIGHANRFKLIGLVWTSGTDGAALTAAWNTGPHLTSCESTKAMDDRLVDEALEEFAPHECRTCSHCGAIVAEDGSHLEVR
jgi:hypothetical protein